MKRKMILIVLTLLTLARTKKPILKEKEAQ
jgi:hypothetical protein